MSKLSFAIGTAASVRRIAAGINREGCALGATTRFEFSDDPAARERHEESGMAL